MSDRAKTFAWASQLPPTERFILLALADHADQDGGHIDTALPSIAGKTGYAHRTVQRTVQKLIERGVLSLVAAPAGQASMYQINLSWQPEGMTHDHPRQGVTPVTRSPLTEDHPPPNSASQRPERAPSRAGASSSSVACVFNPDQVFDDPHEEEAARELVMRLKLTHRQARIGVRANRDGVDVDGWLDWLARVQEPEPMKILVARIKAGEPVPEIHRAPPAAPKPAMIPMPSEAERLAIRQKYSKQARQARQQARL